MYKEFYEIEMVLKSKHYISKHIPRHINVLFNLYN